MEATVRNLDALYLGTGEFSFSPDAISLADARAKGFMDFGNINATGFKPTTEKVEHEGSYRGVRRIDTTRITKALLEYQIKCDEWDREKLKLILGGEDATDMTQSAKNLQVCDAWDFATTPAVIDRWYDVLMSGYQIRDITKICIPKSAAVACTVDPDTDFITAAGHGLSNGTPIYLIADVIPTGATQYEKYYVINATTNTFQIATAFFAGGGAATDFTTSGTTVKYTELLVENTDYVLDAKIGRVRFAAAQAASTTAVVSATIINAGDAASMKAMTPLSQIIRQGFGRLAIFDDQHDNNVVYLHEGFSCEILMESAGDMDGKTIPELTLTVRVTDTVGTIYTAE